MEESEVLTVFKIFGGLKDCILSSYQELRPSLVREHLCLDWNTAKDVLERLVDFGLLTRIQKRPEHRNFKYALTQEGVEFLRRVQND